MLKRYRIKIVRLMDSAQRQSVSDLEMTLEDNTDDDIDGICRWAEEFTDRQLPGYHVSEVTELG